MLKASVPGNGPQPPADVAGGCAGYVPPQAFRRIYLTSLCTPGRGRATPQPLPEDGAASCCQRRSCRGSGHWVCCFCPSHARLRCTSEKAWIKIQGNAVRSLSNTGGRNKTRMKCNGILNRK